MTKFIKMVLEMIDRTDVVSNKGPDEKIHEGEVEEFILEDEELRKLYGIVSQAQKKLQRAISEFRRIALECLDRKGDFKNDPVVAESVQEIHRTFAIFGTLHTLFWNSLKHENPKTLFKTCGIRENWQIVSSAKNQETDHGSGAFSIGIQRELVEKLMAKYGFPSIKKNTVH